MQRSMERRNISARFNWFITCCKKVEIAEKLEINRDIWENSERCLQFPDRQHNYSVNNFTENFPFPEIRRKLRDKFYSTFCMLLPVALYFPASIFYQTTRS